MSAVRALEGAAAPRATSWLDRAARRAVFANLGLLEQGRIAWRDADGAWAFGAARPTAVPGGDSHAALDASVVVTDPSFYLDLLLGGSVGAGGAYARAKWSASDLTTLCRILLRDRRALRATDGAWARVASRGRRIAAALRRNTRRGSRRNIEAHYDLGNDFFRLVLDPTLSYSAARFDRPGMTLEEASLAKMDGVLDMLDLPPGARLLEIGAGWGGFALRAARAAGLNVTTTTISPSQAALADARVAEAGLRDRVRVLRRDYRDLDGTFDGIVSIEMVEAVGAAYYDEYFRVCAARLRAGAPFVLQAIVIEDDAFEAARGDVDFIKWYVFPGSCIPSRAVLLASAARAGFVYEDEVDLTDSYAETLRRWRDNTHRHRARVAALGFDERFLRRWDFYLSYCEAGFEERHTRDLQIRFRRAAATAR